MEQTILKASTSLLKFWLLVEPENCFNWTTLNLWDVYQDYTLVLYVRSLQVYIRVE